MQGVMHAAKGVAAPSRGAATPCRGSSSTRPRPWQQGAPLSPRPAPPTSPPPSPRTDLPTHPPTPRCAGEAAIGQGSFCGDAQGVLRQQHTAGGRLLHDGEGANTAWPILHSPCTAPCCSKMPGLCGQQGAGIAATGAVSSAALLLFLRSLPCSDAGPAHCSAFVPRPPSVLSSGMALPADCLPP